MGAAVGLRAPLALAPPKQRHGGGALSRALTEWAMQKDGAGEIKMSGLRSGVANSYRRAPQSARSGVEPTMPSPRKSRHICHSHAFDVWRYLMGTTSPDANTLPKRRSETVRSHIVENTAISGLNKSVVSREEWLAERQKLLAHEKELTRLRDQIARKRRALPWVRIDKNYVFDAPEGRRTLAELFEGRRQLLVQHFMFAPGWEQGCPSCSFMADHSDGMNVHLAHRDVTL